MLDENGISRASHISKVFQTVFPEKKDFKNPLEFPKSLSHCDSLLLEANVQSIPSKYKHHTLPGCFFLLGTHTRAHSSGLLSSSLSDFTSSRLPLSLPFSCGYTSTAYELLKVCVCMRVSACVRVSGLCSLLLPPCWVFPSPWLHLPLSRSKLQGAGSSPLSGSFTFCALPLPSSYLSPHYVFSLHSLLSQIQTSSFVHEARRVSNTFCVSYVSAARSAGSRATAVSTQLQRSHMY